MNQTRVQGVVVVGILLGLGGGTGCSSAPAQGAEGQSCYPNQTCNAGLTCLSKLCVNAGSGGGGQGGGATGGGQGGGATGGGQGGGTTGGGQGGGATGGGGQDAGTDAGTDAGSCTTPPALHPGGGIYCPYSGTSGNPDLFCTAGTQHCCEAPAGARPSTCQPLATPCPSAAGYVDWRCADAYDCGSPGSATCCPIFGATFAPGATACENVASNFAGTVCLGGAACVNNQLCTQEDCGLGGSCVPYLVNGTAVGVCR